MDQKILRRYIRELLREELESSKGTPLMLRGSEIRGAKSVDGIVPLSSTLREVEDYVREMLGNDSFTLEGPMNQVARGLEVLREKLKTHVKSIMQIARTASRTQTSNLMKIFDREKRTRELSRVTDTRFDDVSGAYSGVEKRCQELLAFIDESFDRLIGGMS